MKGIGLLKDPEAGKVYIDMLDAATLKKRKGWYREALSMFTEQGVITKQEAASVDKYVDMQPDDPHSRQTPYDLASEAGALNKQQADTMNHYIFDKAHSGTALCSGTASKTYSSEEFTVEDVELSTDLGDDSIIKSVNGAIVRLKKAKLHKSGDTSDHSEGSFTGLNAAVLAEGGKIYIEDSTVTSHAIGGNNIFVHGKGSEVYLKNVLLDAYGVASNRCIYVSFGGYLEAENCEFISRGTISSTVATDTGGGTIKLKNCLVKAMGSNCASLYSTGEIIAESCMCLAPETEGLIIVGNNSIEIKDSYVLSGQSQGVKFMSMMGENGGKFSMNGGILAVCEGPIAHVGGAGSIQMREVKVANPSGIAFVAYSMGPNMMREDDGSVSKVTIGLYNQLIEGDTLADKSHGIELNLRENSKYRGSINKDNKADFASVTLDKSSVWELTSDSYISSLSNEDETNSNILCGAFKLITVK